jgi:hypothetical protein
LRSCIEIGWGSVFRNNVNWVPMASASAAQEKLMEISDGQTVAWQKEVKSLQNT